MAIGCSIGMGKLLGYHSLKLKLVCFPSKTTAVAQDQTITMSMETYPQYHIHSTIMCVIYTY